MILRIYFLNELKIYWNGLYIRQKSYGAELKSFSFPHGIKERQRNKKTLQSLFNQKPQNMVM